MSGNQMDVSRFLDGFDHVVQMIDQQRAVAESGHPCPPDIAPDRRERNCRQPAGCCGPCWVDYMHRHQADEGAV